MKWLNYHHLIYFREIAQSGSIAKASESLRVGAPALSAQLKKLEDCLEVELFERRNRRLILTEAGKIALEYAENIHTTGQELLQVLQERSFKTRLSLRVGAIDAIPKHFVCDILDYVHKKTGSFLSIFEGGPTYLLRELVTRHIDVIIADQPLALEGTGKIFSKRIHRAKVHAYASEDFLHLSKNFPHSLQSRPCILPTTHSKLRLDLEHYFYLRKIFLDKVAETQDPIVQKILGFKGDGIIFLPEIAARELVKDRKLFKLGTLNEVFVEYFLVYPPRMIENPAVEILLKQNFRKIQI